jgi:hypothetical protein
MCAALAVGSLAAGVPETFAQKRATSTVHQAPALTRLRFSAHSVATRATQPRAHTFVRPMATSPVVSAHPTAAQRASRSSTQILRAMGPLGTSATLSVGQGTQKLPLMCATRTVHSREVAVPRILQSAHFVSDAVRDTMASMAFASGVKMAGRMWSPIRRNVSRARTGMLVPADSATSATVDGRQTSTVPCVKNARQILRQVRKGCAGSVHRGTRPTRLR